MDRWREYEEEIHGLLSAKADPDADVSFDVKKPGLLSGVDRQIDVFVTGRFAGSVLPDPATLAVDCKCWSRTVNVPDVERFIGLLEDIGADLGLIITTTGFSEAAQRRAERARGINIQVVTFDDLAEWSPPDVWLCEVCEVDTDKHFPGAMHPERFAPGGEVFPDRVFVGQCDRCDAVHVMCTCGTVRGVHEFEEGEDLMCWGCGRTFRVDTVELDRDAVPLDHGVLERVHFK